MWQWWETVRILAPHFNVYVPDLVFFGDSFTTRPDRTDSFQAQCVKRVMDANSVEKMSVVGISYGGFVAYSMAAQFKESIEKVVICSAGVCLEEKDIKEGLFPVNSVEKAAKILLPQTAEKMKELMRYTFVKPPKGIPGCLLEDFIDVRSSSPLFSVFPISGIFYIYQQELEKSVFWVNRTRKVTKEKSLKMKSFFLFFFV